MHLAHADIAILSRSGGASNQPNAAVVLLDDGLRSHNPVLPDLRIVWFP